MKFCMHCGQQLEDSAVFCSNCGTALNDKPIEPEKPAEETEVREGTAPEAPPAAETAVQAPEVQESTGRKHIKVTVKSWKILGVAAAALLVVVLLAVAAGSLLTGGAHKQFLSYQADFFAERVASGMEEYRKLAGMDHFSSDITISADVTGLDDILDDTSILLRVDAQRSKFLLDAEITLMGTPALTGKVQYDKGQLGFILPELDENYYTMDLSAVLSELSGEDIDLTKLEAVELPEREIEALFKEYLELLAGVVTKENVEKTAEDKVRFDELSSYRMSDEEEDVISDLEDGFRGTIYTFTPKAEEIEAVLEALADKLEEDEKLREVMAECIGQEQLMAALGDDLAEELMGTDDLAGDMEDMLDDLADEIRDNGEEFAEAVEDAGFVWTLCMEGKRVRMIRLETEEEECALVYANSTDKSGEVTELFYYCDYGSCEVIEHVYTKDGDEIEGELNFDGLSLEYEQDTGKISKLGLPYGTYELKVDGEKVELEVAENKKGGVDHIVSISDTYSGTDVEVTVNLTEKGTAKAPDGKSKDISNYDEDDFADLFGDMGGELIGVLSDIDELEELISGLYWYF